MTDIVDPATRSRMMSRIRGKDTGPELLVRSFLHKAGLRFRVNVRQLPGRPDLTLPRWNIALFIDGCFWHRHPSCPYAYAPRTRKAFWVKKFEMNVQRDQRNAQDLKRLGWRVIRIWECKIDENRLNRLVRTIRGME